MFFYLSKVVWFILQPSSVVLIILLIGTAMLWSRWARMGRRVVLLAGILLVVIGVSPAGHALILPLEERFARADVTSGPPIDGIIVLGGTQNMSVSGSRDAIALNESGERLVEAAALAHRFPNAKVLLTGESSAFLKSKSSEAEGAANLLESLGIKPDRFVLETRAKNTFQNAKYSAGLMEQDKKDSRWLLITSANHMPRAMGVFRAAGVRVEPWPVDYRTRGSTDIWLFFHRPSEGWRRMDLAVREWVGLVVYWMTGRTQTLFPAPLTT